MMAAGDMMQQRSDFLKKHLSAAKNASKVYAGEEVVGLEEELQLEDSSDTEQYDHIRTRNMTVVGLLQGPFHHYFYAVLERYIPGRNPSSILKKTLLDQSIASPTCLGIFFFGLGALESKNVDETWNQNSTKMFDTWKVDCMFWPPTQLVNFLFVPIQYRVIYINVMTMIYDMFLSYMKYDH